MLHENSFSVNRLEIQKNSTEGLLLVDKPAGITSHDVVDKIRWIAHTRAVGHAGTLDPFATGLLILGIGKATKWLTDLVGLDKTYEAALELGATSDTFDVEGRKSKIKKQKAKIGTEEIECVLEQFRGGYEQKAPLFSAKKLHGKKLYELARAGKATEEMRPIKRVEIKKLQITRYEFPTLCLEVECSSGTYIRSLADDIGRALDIGAYLKQLRRTRIGTWNVTEATPLDELAREEVSLAALIRGKENV